MEHEKMCRGKCGDCSTDCKKCRAPEEDQEPGCAGCAPATPAAISSAEGHYSRGLEIGKFVLFSVLTSGIYHIWWFYKNWKDLKEYTDRPIRPLLRTIGLAVPILDIVLAYQQFRDIRNACREKGVYTFPLGRIVFIFTILAVVAWASFVSFFLSPTLDATMDTSLSLFFELAATLAATSILIPVQKSLNALWLSHEPLKNLRSSYGSGEVAWIVVGGLLWILSILSVFAPPLPPLEEEEGSAFSATYTNDIFS